MAERKSPIAYADMFGDCASFLVGIAEDGNEDEAVARYRSTLFRAMYGEAGRKLVMRVFRLVMLLAVVGVLLVFSNALEAHAWSRLAPPHISDISPGQPIPDHGGSAVVGVFEQEHIAESPWFIFIWLFGGIVAFTVFRRQGSRRV